MALPKTEHPLTDPAKFVWDSWTMPNLLAPPGPGQDGETVIYAVVHGEFTECTSFRPLHLLFDHRAYVVGADIDIVQSQVKEFDLSLERSF